MLNKELLMAGATGKEPHILMTVQHYYDSDMGAKYYGYNAYAHAGKVSRIPCWGRFGTMLNYSALQTLATNAGILVETMINWRNPYTSNRLVVTRLDTEKSVVIFDPPPTIIWIQLRTNRSRNRVLCRRRSLGGSRC